jgi:hypothetical protein
VHVSNFGACGVASVGSLHATSPGIRVPRTANALHAALGGRVFAEVPLVDAVFVWTHADALVSLPSQHIEINGVEAYTLPRLSVGIAVGAGAHFF